MKYAEWPNGSNQEEWMKALGKNPNIPPPTYGDRELQEAREKRAFNCFLFIIAILLLPLLLLLLL